MENVTNFLLNLIKIPTQIIYGLVSLSLIVLFCIAILILGFLSEVWPIGALVLAWYFWW